MPAQDKFLDAVLNALIKDGWTITDRELLLPFDTNASYVDFLAEQTLTAEREGRKIAVEVKTFGGRSVMADLEKALGQFLIYKIGLEIAKMEHDLYLAAPEEMQDFFKRPAASKLRQDFGIKILIYQPQKETIIEWIEPQN